MTFYWRWQHEFESNFTWKINKPVNCGTKNIIYMLECNKDRCNKRYIGQSIQNFRNRISQHLGYIRNRDLSKATGHHFNSIGHTINNVTFTII